MALTGSIGQGNIPDVAPNEEPVLLIQPFFHIKRFKVLIEPPFDLAGMHHVDEGADGGAARAFYIMINGLFHQGGALAHRAVILHVEGKILAPGEKGIKLQSLPADEGGPVHFVP